MDGRTERRKTAKGLSSEDLKRLRDELARSIRETEETLERTEKLLLALTLLHVPHAPWSVVDGERGDDDRAHRRAS